MRFQRERNPESVLIEKRAAEHAALGYPLPEHDTALDAEDIVRAAKVARDEADQSHLPAAGLQFPALSD